MKIDQDNLPTKRSALNGDLNGVRLDPLRSRSPPYQRIKFEYPLENVRFLLLSTNLAREWLQIDTDLLLIITIVVINVRKKVKNVNKRVFYEKKIKNVCKRDKKRYPIFTCF